jgi:hypothetical protein
MNAGNPRKHTALWCTDQGKYLGKVTYTNFSRAKERKTLSITGEEVSGVTTYGLIARER